MSIVQNYVTLHQPEYMPWLGFFNKMSKADYMVIFDSTQYRKNYFQNRNKIYSNNEEGWRYLTAPVKRGHLSDLIKDTQYVDNSFKSKHLQIIKDTYKNHPFFKEVYGSIEFYSMSLYHDEDNLSAYNTKALVYVARLLGINTPIGLSSEMGIEPTLKSSDLVLEICKRSYTDIYIAGPSGRDYLVEKDFREVGIEIVYNDYEHPVYKQHGTDRFVSHLSFVDLVMNVGWEEAGRIIKGVEV